MQNTNFDNLDEELAKILFSSGFKPETWEKVARVPTGSLALDFATSGGWPRAHYSIIWGAEGSGKSTTCLLTAANVTQTHGMAAWVDVEQSFSPEYAEKFGIDVSRLYITRPNSAEKALNDLRNLVKTNAFDFIAFDSAGALAGLKEVSGDVGDANVAIVARLLKDWVNRTNPELSQTKTAVVFINQLRYNIDKDNPVKETHPGGQAFKHGRAITIKLGRAYGNDVKTKGDNVVAVNVGGRVTNNRVGPPMRTFDFTVRMDSEPYGVDQIAEGGPLAIKLGILQSKEGGVYNGRGNAFFDGELMGNGGKNVVKYLYEHHSTFWKIDAKIREALANFAEPIQVTEGDESNGTEYDSSE